jgi:hypothetical protein
MTNLVEQIRKCLQQLNLSEDKVAIFTPSNNEPTISLCVWVYYINEPVVMVTEYTKNPGIYYVDIYRTATNHTKYSFPVTAIEDIPAMVVIALLPYILQS